MGIERQNARDYNGYRITYEIKRIDYNTGIRQVRTTAMAATERDIARLEDEVLG